MATTQLMVQMMYEDGMFGPVTSIPAFFAYAILDLDETKTTVVREIAAEEIGGIVGLKMKGAINLSLTSRVFVEVELDLPKDMNVLLWGPSCVPSPPFTDIGQITLTLTAAGFTAPSGGSLTVPLVGAGAHVYVDQIN